MSRSKPLQQSFAGGEVTPELAGLVASQAFQMGVAECRNFVTLPHGPAQYRPGFRFEQYAAGANHAPRLVPFVPDDANAYVLAFLDQAMFVHSVGGTVEGADTINGTFDTTHPSGLPYLKVATSANPQPLGFVRFVTGPDFLQAGGGWFVASSVGAYGGNSYYALTKPGLLGMSVGYAIDGGDTYPGSHAVTLRLAEMVETPWELADLPYLHFAQSLDVLTVTCRGYAPHRISNPAGVWTVAEDPVATAEPAFFSLTVQTAGTTPARYRFRVYQSYQASMLDGNAFAAFPATGVREVVLAVDPDDGQLELTGTGDSDPRAADVYVLVEIDGTWYYLFSDEAGDLPQIFGLSGFSAVTRDVEQLTEAVGSYTYADFTPRAVAYHEQRKWFGGDDENGLQTLTGLRSGSEFDSTYHDPPRATDACSFDIAALRRNAIEHLVSAASHLIALTGSAVFSVSAQGGISPVNVDIKNRSYVGAGIATPAVSEDAVLYAAARGGRIHEIRYSDERGGLVVNDLSRLAPHLFDGYLIRDMAFQQAPFPVLWVVRSDYRLLSCTYAPQLGVAAWHLHELPGQVHWVCVIPDGIEDAVFVSTRRTLEDLPGGATNVYAIERLAPWLENRRTRAVRLDAALTYDGAGATTIHGLWPLERQTVRVVADGGLIADRQVIDGRITLDVAASVVHVGLPYRGHLKTMPLNSLSRTTGAYGVGSEKSPTAVSFRVHESAGVKTGPSLDKLREPPPRLQTDLLGSPPALRTETRTVTIDATWDKDAAVYLVADEPFPVRILNLAVELEAAGR
ncbi:MAG: hypothetical protein AB7K86_08610 [Rhodospirillales bacterium]